MVSGNLFLTCGLLFTLLASPPICIAMLDPSSSSSVMPKKYIVYTAKRPDGEDPKAYDIRTLSAVLSSEKAAEAAYVFGYYKNINGFVAMLTPEEADKMKKQPGVISVFRSGISCPHAMTSSARACQQRSRESQMVAEQMIYLELQRKTQSHTSPEATE